jgi:hypothetical protein
MEIRLSRRLSHGEKSGVHCAITTHRRNVAVNELKREMSRTPARITQADVARAIRAAQQCGAGSVRIMPDGTILIDPQRQKQPAKEEKAVEPEREIVL